MSLLKLMVYYFLCITLLFGVVAAGAEAFAYEVAATWQNDLTFL